MRRALALIPVLALTGCGSIAVNGTPPSYTSGTTPRALTLVTPGAPPAYCRARGTGLFALPDPKCSPGTVNPNVTQANVASTICKAGWTKTVRPSEKVTRPEKRAEMRAYGITGSPHGYELDHVVPLELGGAPNSYSNYYPEADYPSREGFYPNPKDRLENVLNHLVCRGKMALRIAQHLIAANWVTTFRRYVP